MGAINLVFERFTITEISRWQSASDSIFVRCFDFLIAFSIGLLFEFLQTSQRSARMKLNSPLRRVEAIALKRKFITMKNWDAQRFIEEYLPTLPKKSLVYCDPPYFRKANRLYLNHYKAGDHEQIAKVIQKNIKRPWLVSYDDPPEISAYYSERRSFVYDLQYNAAKAYKGREVFFFRRQFEAPKNVCDSKHRFCVARITLTLQHTSSALAGLEMFLTMNPGRCPGLSSVGLSALCIRVNPFAQP